MGVSSLSSSDLVLAVSTPKHPPLGPFQVDTQPMTASDSPLHTQAPSVVVQPLSDENGAKAYSLTLSGVTGYNSITVDVYVNEVAVQGSPFAIA